MTENRPKLNKELAQMLKGGVIMDVTTPEQARIAEEAGAVADFFRHDRNVSVIVANPELMKQLAPLITHKD